MGKLSGLALGVAVLIAGCTGSPPVPDDIGQVRYEDGGASITVPALWAGKDPDGTPVGGVEPAQIFVSTSSRTPEYSVELADIAAQGAGDAWQAATAMASAFATLYVSADPATVDLDFAVTGPIEGPSAGGILTVGLLAAFQGRSLKPDVTMTGTITADGSIGPVGGVLTKIDAAAREGFTTVVVPAALSPGTWDSGNEFTERAAALSVTLVPVNTIGEAYAAMTGDTIGEPDLSPGPALNPQTQAVTEADTEETLELLAVTLATSERPLPPDLFGWAQEQLLMARSDAARGDTARAYGNGTFVLTEVVRALASEEAEELIQAQGSQRAGELLAGRARAVLDQAERTLAEASFTPVRGLPQCFALPTAMGWSTFAQVTMEGVLAELAQGSDDGTLVEMAASIAEGELGMSVFLPQSLRIVQSLDEAGGEDCGQFAGHLSAYSRFLVRAADAAATYSTNVLDATLDDAALKADYTKGAAAAGALAQDVTAQIDSYPDEAEQYALAATYFWLATYATSAKQAYAVSPGESPGRFAAMRKEAMEIAVDQTWWFVKTRAEALSRQGLDAGATSWSGQWALEESLRQRNSPYSTAADWLALGQLWFDALQMTAAVSYLEPSTIPSAPE